MRLEELRNCIINNISINCRNAMLASISNANPDIDYPDEPYTAYVCAAMSNDMRNEEDMKRNGFYPVIF